MRGLLLLLLLLAVLVAAQEGPTTFPPASVSGGVSWPLLAPDGSSTAPSYGFASYTKSGTYKSGTSVFIGNAEHDTSYTRLQANEVYFALTSGDTGVTGHAVLAYGKASDDEFRTRVTTSTGNYTEMRLRPSGLDLNALGTGVAQFHLEGMLFSALGSPADGSIAYCSDCTKATPCTDSGDGALAKRLNGAWDCD